MKKTMNIVLALLATIALVAVAVDVGESISIIKEVSGNTTYTGLARATENGAPSTNAAVWKIIREVVSGDTTTITFAYGSGTGYNALWSTAWTNRVNATYK